MPARLRTVAIAAGCMAIGAAAAPAQNPFRTATDAMEARFGRAQPVVSYVLRVAPHDTSGFDVEMWIRNTRDTFRIGMAAHPEYDDRYWRYVTHLRAESPGGGATIVRLDSALWLVTATGGEVTVRYRLSLPAQVNPNRNAWRVFLARTGGLVGGPHSFMYVIGSELAPAHVRFDLPPDWDIATGLVPTTDQRVFFAPTADVLIDSPALIGHLRNWAFMVDGVPHRIAYWPLPDAAQFDTAEFINGIEQVVRQSIKLFGRAPYRDYTFLMSDGAFGGLEHGNSVTIGAPSASLARDPNALLSQTAHEYFHTWNEVRIRPVEFRGIDYRTAPVSSGLWWTEGVTMMFADLLLRRAGLPTGDSTRTAHLAGTIARYLGNSGNTRLSPEQVSRISNTTNALDYGDDSPSVHVQGELLGDMLDLIIRNATDGRRSIDDVMRAAMERYSGATGFTNADIEHTVNGLCTCVTHAFFEQYVHTAHPINLNRYLALIGLQSRVTYRASTNADGTPSPDSRASALIPPGASRPILRVFDRSSIWARSGLHTGDTLVSMNDVPVTGAAMFRAAVGALRVSDSVRVEIIRPTGRRQIAFVMSGVVQPIVTIEEMPGATERQRRLRGEWAAGR
jgi:predicted metalloprotease with PDZ domain